MPSSTLPIHAAIEGGSTGAMAAAIRRALAAGADVNARDAHGRTPLLLFVLRAPIVTLILDAGADPNAVDEDGRSVLADVFHRADGDRKDYVESARILLARGLNPELRDDDGDTLLLAAVCRGFLRHVVVLVAAGANAGAKDADGRGPLQCAVESFADEAGVKKMIDAVQKSPTCDPADVAAARAAATAKGWVKVAARLV